MVDEGDWVLIFHSIHKVMRAEQVLKAENVPMLLIPVPRQLASDCGLAIRFKPQDLTTGLSQLQSAALMPAERYQMCGGRYVLSPG